MRKGNGRENIKVIVLTEKDRKLLQSIDNSLKDIKKGRIKEFLSKKIRESS
jgi:hypothetical protein